MMHAPDAELTPARPIGNVYVGATSWTERTLLETDFYPRAFRSAQDRLRYYASRFPLVEVDSTFYAPPSLRNSRLWAERAPSGFLMNIKVYGLLTLHAAATRSLPPEVREKLPRATQDRPRVYLHHLPRQAQDLIWALHVDALKPLEAAGKLGALLFQFPYWFHVSRKNRDFLREVKDRIPYRVAVEFRGGGWMDEDTRARTLSLLESLGFTYVVVDEPQGFRSSTPPVVARTAPLAMIRLHGRNAATWEQRVASAADRFNYLYEPSELEEWAGTATSMADDSEQVHVLFNNCYRDYAVRNAEQMAELLKPAGGAPTHQWSAAAPPGPIHGA